MIHSIRADLGRPWANGVNGTFPRMIVLPRRQDWEEEEKHLVGLGSQHPGVIHRPMFSFVCGVCGWPWKLRVSECPIPGWALSDWKRFPPHQL